MACVNKDEFNNAACAVSSELCLCGLLKLSLILSLLWDKELLSAGSPELSL